MVCDGSVYGMFQAIPVIVQCSGTGVGRLNVVSVNRHVPYDRVCVSSRDEQDRSLSAFLSGPSEVCVNKTDVESLSTVL